MLHKRLAALHDRIVRSAHKTETRLTDKVRRADDLANVFTGRDVTTKAEVAQQNVTGGVWPRQKDVLRLQQKNTMPSIQVHWQFIDRVFLTTPESSIQLRVHEMNAYYAFSTVCEYVDSHVQRVY